MKIDQYLTKFLIAKSLPLTIIDCKEFKDFINSLDMRYKIPGYKKIRNTLVPANANKIRQNLKSSLSKIAKLNISSDIWSDPSMRSFIGFCAHGIDNDWNLIKGLVGIKRLLGSHTNELIYDEFLKIVKEFEIEK